MNNSKFAQLTQAKEIMNKGKYKESLKIVNRLEKKGENSSELQFSLLIFKAELFMNMGFGSHTIKYADQAYQLSQKLGKHNLSFDALFFKFYGCYMVEDANGYTKTLELLNKLFTSLKKDKSKEFIKRKSLFAFIKACEAAFIKNNSETLTLNIINEGNALLEIIGDKIGKIRNFNLMGYFYQAAGDLDKASSFYKKSLLLSKKIGNYAYFAESLSSIATICRLKGELDEALEYTSQSLKFEDLTGIVKIENFLNIGEIYKIKGELNLALKFCETGLKIALEIDLKYKIARCLWRIGQIKWINGNLKGASENLEQCLKISQEYDFYTNIVNSLFHLVRVNVDLGSNKKAEIYLNNLNQLLLQNLVPIESQWQSQLYRVAKAYILKNSNRARYKGEAEMLYKQITEEKVYYFELTVFAIIELCDLLLREIQITNDPAIFSELEPYIEQLQEISKNKYSYRYLAETKLLQAKFSLIKLEIEQARRFFTQAQKLADKHGLELLAHKISSEHDKFLEQLDMWEKLNKTNAPMTKRIKLASLDGVMDLLQEKRAVEQPKIETEQPVLLAILSKTGYLMFSNPFTADITFNEQKLGSFISTLSSSSNQLFSEAIDRIKIGDYMVLLKKLEEFSICYVFRGESYSAGQKLQNFTEAVKENKNIINVLNSTVRTSHQINLNENSDLEELITNSFMADPKNFKLPFQAYKGDEPFLFVSYAHSDKLQVYPIMDYLNKSGFNVWYDEGISVSDNWKKSIVTNIENCTAFLVFITPHIIDSEYVRKEIDFALSRKKKFFSVYLKDTKLPSEMEFDLSMIQAMKKYAMDDSEFYSKIKEVLSPVLSKKI